MAETGATPTTLPTLVAEYYNKKFLDRLIPELFMYMFGQKDEIPKREGNIIHWLKYLSMAAATASLEYGTTPTAVKLSATEVSATLEQKGGYTVVSDIMPLVAVDPTIESAIDVMGENGATSIDTIIRDVMIGGATVQYANNKVGISALRTSDIFDSANLRKAIRTLEAANVRPHKMGKRFIAMINPYGKYDLTGDTATGSWVDVTKYTSANVKRIHDYEIGEIYNAKFFSTTQVRRAGEGFASANICENFLFGDGAYGIADLAGAAKINAKGKPRIITKDVKTGGTADPLEQRNTVAWKADFVSKVLGADRLLNFKAGSTG